MLAAVLNTPVAIRASVQVVRAFVKLRRMMSASRQILQRLDALEKTSSGHDNHIRALFETIREMMDPEAPPPRRIGFKVEEKARHYRT